MQEQQTAHVAKQQRNLANPEGLYETVNRGIALIRAAGGAFTQVTRGLSTPVTRTGAGVYVVTLAVATPSANCQTTSSVYGAADAGIDVVHTSDTVKTVNTFNQAGAAADFDFDVSFAQLV